MLTTPGGADRHLAAALFAEFLEALVEAVESEVNDAKVAVSTVRESIKSLGGHRKRILQAARSESARFAALDATIVTKLLDGLQQETMGGLPSDPSLDDAAGALAEVTKDFESAENQLARLDTAYQDILSMLTEQPPWKSDPSAL